MDFDKYVLVKEKNGKALIKSKEDPTVYSVAECKKGNKWDIGVTFGRLTKKEALKMFKDVTQIINEKEQEDAKK